MLAISACAQESVEQGREYFMDSGCYGCHIGWQNGNADWTESGSVISNALRLRRIRL
jgi:hypothetical protein